MKYCVVTSTGCIRYQGMSLVSCAAAWQPSTFWGEGETKQDAMKKAREYAEKYRVSNQMKRVAECGMKTGKT